MLTIDQWLQLVKGRQASDLRDFVTAGLSLVRADDLLIDPKIYAKNESQRGIRPWLRLDVDYTISTTEILLHLAACMLSKPGGVRLLLYPSRVRDLLGVDAEYSAAGPSDHRNARNIPPITRLMDIAAGDASPTLILASILEVSDSNGNNGLASYPHGCQTSVRCRQDLWKCSSRKGSRPVRLVPHSKVSQGSHPTGQLYS
jgi:hypothetical protein